MILSFKGDSPRFIKVIYSRLETLYIPNNAFHTFPLICVDEGIPRFKISSRRLLSDWRSCLSVDDFDWRICLNASEVLPIIFMRLGLCNGVVLVDV
jgi:hypothetical protein